VRGGAAYRDTHASELPHHVLAMESDGGVFQPLGFGFTGSDGARETLKQVASLLEPIGATRINLGSEATDLGPLVRAAKVPSLSLDVDMSRYFFVHHTAADTVDKIRPEEIARSVAAIATMAYVVADMPARLGQ
jgi:carboxypeptidase Q